MFHGSAAVGNGDELGVLGKAKKIIRVAVNVRFVKSSLDFVQDAERCGTDFEDCKIDCDCNKGLFTTGKRSKVSWTMVILAILFVLKFIYIK